MHDEARIETLKESLLSENPPVKEIEMQTLFHYYLLEGRKHSCTFKLRLVTMINIRSHLPYICILSFTKYKLLLYYWLSCLFFTT